MAEYLLKNTFKVKIDFENAKINSIIRNEEMICGDVCFYAVKLRYRSGESKIIDAKDGKFVSFSGEVAYYTHEEIDVSVRVKSDGERLLWRVFIKNKTDALIEYAEVGSFGVYNKLKDEIGGRGAVIYPYNEGVEVTNMPLRESVVFRYCEPEYPSYGKYNVFPYKVSSQYIAYLLGGDGVYLGMHDGERTPKHIDFRYYENAIRVQSRVFCNVSYGEDYSMPFDTVTECFSGGWQDACEIYRKWFENNLPSGLKKINESEFPAWYGESPLVVIYPVRGSHDEDKMGENGLYPYENAIQYLKNLSSDTKSKVMALLMHWEGTAPWAPPFVLPPYGGTEIFKNFVRKMHAENMLVGVYGSGIGWTQQSYTLPSYNREEEYKSKSYANYMCTDTVGKTEGGICREQKLGYDFCVSTEEIKKIFKSEWEGVCSLGVDYAQAFDQNHGGSGYFCYSDKHGHIPVPGKWIVEESAALIDRVDKGETLFGSETATAEPYIAKLRFSDNRYELNYYVGIPVPMYSYVYHEYINNFMGNQVGLPLSRENYCYSYRAAYSFAAGDMLSVVMTDKGEISNAWGKNSFNDVADRAVACQMIKNLNAWRQKGGKEFLHFGKMVKPLPFKCGKNKFKSIEGNDIFVDELITSAFACGTKTLQFIINYNLAPRTVDLRRKVKVFFDPEMKDEKIASEITIPPLTAIAVEI